jgi:hypothetical protein
MPQMLVEPQPRQAAAQQARQRRLVRATASPSSASRSKAYSSTLLASCLWRSRSNTASPLSLQDAAHEE